MVQMLRQPLEDAEKVCRVLRQASFLSCSLRGRQPLQWEQRALRTDRIAASTRRMRKKPRRTIMSYVSSGLGSATPTMDAKSATGWGVDAALRPAALRK